MQDDIRRNTLDLAAELDPRMQQRLQDAPPAQIGDLVSSLMTEIPSHLPMFNEYAIYDTLMTGYTEHFPSFNDATAVRDVRERLLAGAPRYANHPESFVLEYIGQWDQGSGDLLPDDHRRILNLKEILHGTD